MVSQCLWGLAQHHSDFHVIILLRRRQLVVDIHLMLPRSPTFLELCQIVTHPWL